MGNFLRKAAMWLGYTPDDAVDELYDDEVLYSERVYPEEKQVAHQANVTPINTRQELSVVPAARDIADYVVLRPAGYPDAKKIGEEFREGYPVVMVLADLSVEEKRRLVDFAAGVAFALHGKIERILKGVFLMTPKDVAATAEDLEKIKGGLADQA